jgi:hypothetical protein
MSTHDLSKEERKKNLEFLEAVYQNESRGRRERRRLWWSHHQEVVWLIEAVVIGVILGLAGAPTWAFCVTGLVVVLTAVSTRRALDRQGEKLEEIESRLHDRFNWIAEELLGKPHPEDCDDHSN